MDKGIKISLKYLVKFKFLVNFFKFIRLIFDHIIPLALYSIKFRKGVETNPKIHLTNWVISRLKSHNDC